MSALVEQYGSLVAFLLRTEVSATKTQQSATLKVRRASIQEVKPRPPLLNDGTTARLKKNLEQVETHQNAGTAGVRCWAKHI